MGPVLLPREPARPAPARRGAGVGVRRGPGVGRVPVPRGGGARASRRGVLRGGLLPGSTALLAVRDGAGSGPGSGPTRGGPSGSATSLLVLARGLCRADAQPGLPGGLPGPPVRLLGGPDGGNRASTRYAGCCPATCSPSTPGVVLPGSSTGTGSSGPPTSGLLTREEAGARFAWPFRAAVAERLRRGSVAAHLSGGSTVPRWFASPPTSWRPPAGRGGSRRSPRCTKVTTSQARPRTCRW